MKFVPLGEVATIDRATVNPNEIPGDTQYVGLEHITKFSREVHPVTAETARLSSTKHRFDQHQILYGKLRPYLAKIATPDFDGVCSTDILPLTPCESIDRSYLYYFLSQPSKVREVSKQATGANLPRVKPAALENLKIPLPPLDEQRRIAAILDKADAIRQKRRQAIAHLDTLTQSIFRKMTRADKFDQSETGRFGELFKLKSGSFLPKSEQEPGEFPVYGGNGITGMHIEYLFGEPKIAIGRVGANCGAVHLTRPQSWITDNALYVDSTYRHFADEYLVFLLRSLDLNQYANRSGQPSISANRLNDIEIKIPELKVQTEFAHLANFIEAQSESHKVSLEYFESLFESLQSRAFRGEL